MLVKPATRKRSRSYCDGGIVRPHRAWTFPGGRYGEAIAEYKAAAKLDPDHRDAYVGLAATYAVLGREEEARTEVSEILRIEPSFSIKKYERVMYFQVGLEHEIEDLRKAGLPE